MIKSELPMSSVTKKIFIVLALLCCTSTVHAARLTTDLLPEAIRLELNHQYPGWQLYDLDAMQPGERKFCSIPPGSGSVVHGDFNGDGRADYAVLISWKRRGALVGFVTRRATFVSFAISEGDSGAYLSITPRGTSYVTTGEGAHAPRPVVLKHDAVVAYRCEADATQFIFKNGRFAYQE
jgi:hypothetical protein